LSSCFLELQQLHIIDKTVRIFLQEKRIAGKPWEISDSTIFKRACTPVSIGYPIDISELDATIVIQWSHYEGRSMMTHVQTKLFKSNKSQAVRLLKNVAFPDSVKTVEITVVGRKRIIQPKGQCWDEWFDSPGVSEDFMEERWQPEDQLRENL
jgi:antitoxin VapB